MTEHPNRTRIALRVTGFHVVAVALVFVFVNLFSVWRSLGEAFGLGVRDALPWIAVGALVAVGVCLLSVRRWRMQVSWSCLVASALACAAGLAIADPDFPAKRIHVPEYFLLASVVWLSVPARLRTPATPVLVLACAALYGVHDEFLQGLSPNRTYGLRDMLVNLCGVAGGTFAFTAFGGVPRSNAVSHHQAGLGPGALAALAASLAGAVLFAWAATGYRNDIVPYWSLLPVLAGAFWTVLAAGRLARPGDRLTMLALSAICMAFLIYPVLTHVTRLDFA
ncbi:MAG: VanZ family protein [Rhodospirillaceae bacterium]